MSAKDFKGPGESGRGLNRLLTPEQVAELLQVKPKTVKGLLRAGKLKGVKVGKLWRVKEADLKAFLGESPEP